MAGSGVAKFHAQVGSIVVIIKDDRAILKGSALKAWKQAASELIEGACDLISEEVEEVAEDGSE